MTTALLVVDVQRDFCEGGSLAVTGGAALASAISAYLREGGAAYYDHIIATRDHHIDPGNHFADMPDFVQSWPPHCVVGTAGVELHPDLDLAFIESVFDKGEYAAAYSGFEATRGDQPLRQWLIDRAVDTVHVVGIATDYCVRHTALDAVRLGFDTRVLLDLTAGVAEESSAAAILQFRAAGIDLD